MIFFIFLVFLFFFMENIPLVSIIIRTCNRPGLLAQALASVAAQDYPAIELLLVNDGGEDVGALFESFAGRVTRSRYIPLRPGRGRGGALNAGLEQARGRWIGFLDDDDLFLPSHISTLLAWAGNSCCGLVYGRTRVIRLDAPGEPSWLFAQSFSYPGLLVDNYIPLISCLVHCDLVALTGTFDQQLAMFEDWDYFIRAGQWSRFSACPQVTVEYRRHSGSITVDCPPDSTRFADCRRQVWEKNRVIIHRHLEEILDYAGSQYRLNLELRREQSACAELRRPFGMARHIMGRFCRRIATAVRR